MKNKNLLILLAAVLLIGAVAAAGLLLRPGITTTPTGGVLATTDPADGMSEHTTPPVEEPSTGETDEPDEREMAYEPPEAYLLVQVRDTVYQPIPLLKEGEFTIRQPEGEMENTVHITRRGFWMVSSTCDNQDCVHQGEASLDNMDSRVLGGMVICLPNQVSLELISPAQAEAMIAQAAAAEAAGAGEAPPAEGGAEP